MAPRPVAVCVVGIFTSMNNSPLALTLRRAYAGLFPPYQLSGPGRVVGAAFFVRSSGQIGEHACVSYDLLLDIFHVLCLFLNPNRSESKLISSQKR
jgi:hypothetical protein